MSSNKYNFKPQDHQAQLVPILRTLDHWSTVKPAKLQTLLKAHPKNNQGLFTKSDLIEAYRHFATDLNLSTSASAFAHKLVKKPIRTQSGVTPVTVLTKPFPCPGKCIFCPNDVRMPKSYLSSEPGAQRATRNSFDPYLQTYNRLLAFHKNGHNIDKVELIILGGTWSYYPEEYQLWFINRCFDALNDFGANRDRRPLVKTAIDFTAVKQTVDGANFTTTYNQEVSKELVKHTTKKLLNDWEHASWDTLLAAQKQNETSKCRNVGLVIETRPDNISPDEVIRIRRLGCTKTQIGFQSLQDKVLSLNKRGHDVAATRRAMKLLRAAGLKIHVHWMPNLYGSTVKKDIADFKKIFSDPDFRPDELKIYPCSLIATAELMTYHQKGLWEPYTHDQLLQVLTTSISATPAYCRLTRVIRDIPSDDIVVGNKKTNFRQIAEHKLDSLQIKRRDIRSREIKGDTFDPKSLQLKTISYQTSTSTEKFLQFVTPEYKIVGFLRLSLPKSMSFWSEGETEAIESKKQIDHVSRPTQKTRHPELVSGSQSSFLPELNDSAIIREVHIYGTSANLGEHTPDKPQHLGLGTKLIDRAKSIAKKSGYKNLAVISAIGTRQYYRRQGFADGDLYQHFSLN